MHQSSDVSRHTASQTDAPTSEAEERYRVVMLAFADDMVAAQQAADHEHQQQLEEQRLDCRERILDRSSRLDRDHRTALSRCRSAYKVRFETAIKMTALKHERELAQLREQASIHTEEAVRNIRVTARGHERRCEVCCMRL